MTSPMQWQGTGKRPWMQDEPVTSYDRNQGGSGSTQQIYPLEPDATPTEETE